MFKLIQNTSSRKWIFENNHLRKTVEVCIKPKQWKMLNSKVILPFSVDSAIYTGTNADEKIKAFIQSVKAHAKQDIMVLFCEGAHLNALSLRYGSINDALNISREQAQSLLKRFSADFTNCQVSFWEDFVWHNLHYNKFKETINNMFQTDQEFANLIKMDVMKLKIPSMLAPEHQEQFTLNTLYDLFEMLAGIKIMSNEGYRVLIYPGALPLSYKYLVAKQQLQMLFINASIKCL